MRISISERISFRHRAAEQRYHSDNIDSNSKWKHNRFLSHIHINFCCFFFFQKVFRFFHVDMTNMRKGKAHKIIWHINCNVLKMMGNEKEGNKKKTKKKKHNEEENPYLHNHIIIMICCCPLTWFVSHKSFSLFHNFGV